MKSGIWMILSGQACDESFEMLANRSPGCVSSLSQPPGACQTRSSQAFWHSDCDSCAGSCLVESPSHRSVLFCSLQSPQLDNNKHPHLTNQVVQNTVPDLSCYKISYIFGSQVQNNVPDTTGYKIWRFYDTNLNHKSYSFFWMLRCVLMRYVVCSMMFVGEIIGSYWLTQIIPNPNYDPCSCESESSWGKSAFCSLFSPASRRQR